jgi:hypothetical protein
MYNSIKVGPFVFLLQMFVIMENIKKHPVHTHIHQNNRRGVSYYPVLGALGDEKPSEFMRFTSAKHNTYPHSHLWVEEKSIL